MKDYKNKYLSVTALAKYLSVSKSYISQNWPKWITQHRIEAIRLSERKILFKKSDIDLMLQNYRIKGE
jgi:excisionase family DNA binding protein